MKHQTIAVMCVLLLAACGDSNDDSNGNGVEDTGVADAGTGTSGDDAGTETSGDADGGTVENGLSDLVIETIPGSGEQETFEVIVAPGDLSVHLSFIGSDSTGDIGVLQVRDPQGELVYDLNVSDDDFFLNSEQWLLPAVGVGSAALLIPPTPAFGNIEGTWQVTAIAPDASITGMQAIHKRDVGASEHALDLDIWFAVEDAPLSTMQEQTAFIDAIVDEMSPILRPHQMFIGDIKLSDRNAQLSSTYADLDVENLETLCEEIAKEETPGRALRIVVVDLINDNGSPCCGGVAPASPGPLLRGDAPPSCVVVSYGAYGTSYAEHAGNFLHEGAHFFGLPHTSEFDGATFDRFTDTPICDIATYDMDGDGRVDDFECGEAGGANNFLFAGGVPEFLPYHASEQQAAVMRMHPLFRPR